MLNFGGVSLFKCTFEDDFAFPQLGFVSSLEGSCLFYRCLFLFVPPLCKIGWSKMGMNLTQISGGAHKSDLFETSLFWAKESTKKQHPQIVVGLLV